MLNQDGSTKSKSPKVSVCIPNYNYGRFIGQAIESVLDQTFTDFELIIVDDASRDDSVAVVKSFSDARIKFYQNEKNIGRVKNINKSLSLASGEFVTLLPSDDAYLPTSLQRRVETLDSNPGVGLVYSSYRTVNEDGVNINEHHPFSQDYIISGEEEFKRLILSCPIATLTVMVRRECYITLGTFNEAVTGEADWETWLRICLNGYELAFIAEPLACDRIHSSNATTYHRQTNLTGMNRYRAIKTVFSNLSPEKAYLSYLEPEAIEALARYLLVQARVNSMRQSRLARRNIGLAIAIDEGVVKDWRTWIFFFATLLPGFIKRAIIRVSRKFRSYSLAS